MAQCKTCGENKFIGFCSSECESYSGNKTVVKNGKCIYNHVTTLMKECNISFEQALEIIKIVNLHEILDELNYLKKQFMLLENNPINRKRLYIHIYCIPIAFTYSILLLSILRYIPSYL